MELTAQTLRRPNLTLHYWVGGVETGPVVVFTHGATVDHRAWLATLPLVGAQCRVAAWDVRGHGRSRPAVFDLGAAVDDLATLLDALDTEQAILVGHSMGGNLHQELAFRHPDRVCALACLGCTWNFQKLSTLDHVILGLAGPLLRAYPQAWLVAQSLAATAATPEGQAVLRPAMETHSSAEFAQIITALARCLHHEPGYAIGKPLLLMVGEQDATGNIRKVMPRWAQQEPHSEFVVIPNARHAANLDNPAFFHSWLLDWLQRLLSAAAKDAAGTSALTGNPG